MTSLLEEVLATRALPDPARRKAIRQAAKVTQVRMAAELGTHRMTVARWESGEREPSGAYRVAYARLLGLLDDACS